MLLLKLSYLAFSVIVFLITSFPLRFEFRNQHSFFSNLKTILNQRKPGSFLLTLSFLNLIISASLFILFSNKI